jgi:hypothetical protein
LDKRRKTVLRAESRGRKKEKDGGGREGDRKREDKHVQIKYEYTKELHSFLHSFIHE